MSKLKEFLHLLVYSAQEIDCMAIYCCSTVYFTHLVRSLQ